ILSGIQHPTNGSVYMKADRVDNRPVHELARRGLARTFQIPRLFTQMSILDNVMTSALTRVDVGRAETLAVQALGRVGLVDDLDRMPSHLNLAGRRRLELARLLVLEPRIVLLDEAMSGLDRDDLGKMVELVRDLKATGVTLILVEHLVPIVRRLCPR